MASNKKLKKAIRERMGRTDESYSTARRHILAKLSGIGRGENLSAKRETWFLTVTLGDRKYLIADGPLPDGIDFLPGLEIGEKDLVGEPGSPPWSSFSFPMTKCGPICDAIWKGAELRISVWRGGPFLEGHPKGITPQLTGKVPDGGLDVVHKDYVVRGKVVATNVTYMNPTVVGPEVMQELIRNTRVIQHAFVDPKHPPVLDLDGPAQVGQHGRLSGGYEADFAMGHLLCFPDQQGVELWVRVATEPQVVGSAKIAPGVVVAIGEPALQPVNGQFVFEYPKIPSSS